MAPKRNYTKDQMASAIEEVKRGEKVSVAAEKYRVPRITLRNKLTGISPLECSLGPATVLTREEENLLVKWILLMQANHFPVTKEHLLDSVQKIIAEKNLVSCPFTDNRRGKKWFASFLKRHPELAERTAQNLSRAREDVSEKDIENWFKTNKEYIESQGLLDALNNPNRIYNADESAFFLQPKPGRVLVRKGEKNVYVSSGDDKENLTVLLTGNAAGVLAPPMIVYSYERLPAAIINSVPKEWCIGRSATGWMCGRTFFEYVTNVFNPWLEKLNVPKPVILFLDGHRSHMTLHLAEFCKANGIEIIALYPNSTHLLQPMDVAVFRPLKVFWHNQVRKWRNENPGIRLKKENFASNLQAAIEKVSIDTIKNRFRKSGLHPFSSQYVDMSKISSRNRSISTATDLTAKRTQFMTMLNSEIQNVFSSEKLDLFNSLYYMHRNELENAIPHEDQSLFVIWAKIKNELAGTAAVLTTETAFTNQSNPTSTLDISAPLNIININHTITSQEVIQPENVDSTSGQKLPNLPLETSTKTLTLTDQEQQKPNQELTPPSQELTEQDETQRPNPLPLLQTPIKYQFQINRNQEESNKNPTPPQEIIQNKPVDKITQEQLQLSIQELPTRNQHKTNEQQSLEITPLKNTYNTTISLNETVSKPSTSKTQPDMNIPSPFKRALYWPEPEIKKQRIKERLPTAITGDIWRNYMAKKEEEKKKKEEEKEKRIEKRKEKQILREKNIQKKKAKKAIKQAKTQVKKIKIRRQQISSSSSDEDNTDIEYQESEYDVLEEYLNDEMNESETEENIPLAALAQNVYKKGRYVILTYEGEHFPGLIMNIEDGHYEITTMVLSKGNTFRWPETVDKIWYSEKAIVEAIEEPVQINKRGVYRVKEMEKYLPFISL